MDCPVTGEFCPSLTEIETRKDRVRPTAGLSGLMLAAATRAQTPYDQIEARSEIALRNPNFCNARRDVDTCGVETLIFGS